MHDLALPAAPPRYEPVGWTQWPDDPDFSFQFLRTLAAAQEGASTIGECFRAASRMRQGDGEDWHREWMALGDANAARADAAEAAGHVRTARAVWLRAANYYRSAEFFLHRHDPRRPTTFDRIEACSHRHLALLHPAGEVVRVPHGPRRHMDGYLLHPPRRQARQPVVICFGGLDEYKDELLHEMAGYLLARGLSALLLDLPGQGGTLRRQGIVARHDTEVPVRDCVDWLLARHDIDPDRILLYGASLGGYYASRAAAFEHRLRAVVSDGGMYDYPRVAARRRARLQAGAPEPRLVEHMRFVTGTDSLEAAMETLGRFQLEAVIGRIRCPYLLVFGEHDFLGLDQVTDAHAAAKAAGVDVTLKLFTAEETGAAHCQVDNPTIGQEVICDWLADRAGIRQGELPR